MKNKVIIALCCLAAGCSFEPAVRDSAPAYVPIDVMAVPDAVPRYEPRTRAGNPGSYEVLGKQYRVLAESKGFRQRGIASWYGVKFHGKKTSNGEVYDMYAMTAAHKTLPIPSYVRVTNLKNRRSVVVRINDRGPFHDNRIIDLSYTAAVKLGIQQAGTGFVEIETLEPGDRGDSIARQNSQPEQRDRLYLQVGAFSDPFNARQLQQKLAGIASAKARLKVAQNRGDTLYKVLLGPVDSVAVADSLNRQLAALGLTDSALVSSD